MKLNDLIKLEEIVNDIIKSDQDIKLEHYSPEQGLKTIEPKYHGTRGIGEENKATSPEHKHAFFYEAGTKPEDLVVSGSKSKYIASIHPSKIYDMGTDPSGVISRAKEKSNEKQINRGVLTRDELHQAIKDAGFHGFKNSTLGDQMGNVIAMYHPVDIHSEEPIGFNKSENDLEKGFKSAIAGLGIVASLAGSPTQMDAPKVEPQERTAVAQKPKIAEFGSQPQDRFLHNIMQVETSGGTNLDHPKIKYGMHKGSQAVGRFALMPKTIKEVANRYRMQGGSHPDIDVLHNMPIDKVADHINKNPHAELELARTLAKHVIGRHGENYKAAYAWKYGHNLKSKDINQNKLNSDPYTVNFRKLNHGQVVRDLKPADGGVKTRGSASIQKAEGDRPVRQASGNLQQAPAASSSVQQTPAPKQLTGPVENQPPKVKLNPEHGRIIADAYEQMKHDPNHPAVKAAYGSLINETNNQVRDLIKKGYKFSKIQPEQENPYPTSSHMHDDVVNNKHLWYYPTEQGYGGAEKLGKDPMLEYSGIEHNGHKMLNNDAFRVGHDILGHVFGGKTKFGPSGEHQAYLAHKGQYSSVAHPALAAQTLMQNQYVNFGPNAEHNRKNPEKTIYAPQKIGIAPPWVVNGKWHGEE